MAARGAAAARGSWSAHGSALAPSFPEAAVPWDAATNRTWTLTASNTTAEVASGSSIRSVLGTTSRASGKFYFEVVFVSGGTFGSGVRHDIGVTTAHPVSSGASGVGSGAGYRRSGDIFVGGASVATVTALSAGDVVGVLLIWTPGKSGSVAMARGHPATRPRRSPAATISTGTYWPFASGRSGAAMKVTLRSTAASFTGSIPRGWQLGHNDHSVPTGSDTAVRLVPFICSRDAAYHTGVRPPVPARLAGGRRRHAGRGGDAYTRRHADRTGLRAGRGLPFIAPEACRSSGCGASRRQPTCRRSARRPRSMSSATPRLRRSRCPMRRSAPGAWPRLPRRPSCPRRGARPGVGRLPGADRGLHLGHGGDGRHQAGVTRAPRSRRAPGSWTCPAGHR